MKEFMEVTMSRIWSVDFGGWYWRYSWLAEEDIMHLIDDGGNSCLVTYVCATLVISDGWWCCSDICGSITITIGNMYLSESSCDYSRTFAVETVISCSDNICSMLTDDWEVSAVSVVIILKVGSNIMLTRSFMMVVRTLEEPAASLEPGCALDNVICAK